MNRVTEYNVLLGQCHFHGQPWTYGVQSGRSLGGTFEACRVRVYFRRFELRHTQRVWRRDRKSSRSATLGIQPQGWCQGHGWI